MNPRPARTRPGSTSPVGRPTLQPNPEQIQVSGPPTPQSQTPAVTDSQTNRVTDSGSTEVPKYRTLVRKEARLRAEQADALAGLRRRLAAARTDRTEVLTDNTLIRVAVDLLLTHADELAGDTEQQLTDSVTHRLPE